MLKPVSPNHRTAFPLSIRELSTIVSAETKLIKLGPVVQSPINANPRLTLKKTYGVNSGLVINQTLNNRSQVLKRLLVALAQWS